MVKLRRLKIERYRNVEPCDLTFGDGLNVVLGQNGAGKTTLLNLISKVLRTSLADTSDPFAIEIELVFPGGSLSGRIATREPERLPRGLGSPGGLQAARPRDTAHVVVPDFDLVLQLKKLGEKSHLRRGHGAVEWKRTSPEGTEGRSLPLTGFLADTSLLQQPLLFGGQADPVAISHFLKALLHPLRFDEGLDTYRAIVAKVEDAGTHDPDLHPEWWVYPQAGGGPMCVPEGFLPQTLSDAAKAAGPELSGVRLTHDKVHFLSETVRLLNLQSAEAKFELLEKSTEPQKPFSRFGNLKFWFTRKDGSIFQDHQLSYGQKRLLAFLYYLDANPGFVIADELVNGMHHRWIEESVRAIGDRQAFLTSQNPLLLDYLTFDFAEQVRSSFVVCRTEMRDGRERMVWRNFTDDEADMFYSAYRVGIEHVGEILRTRGLW